MGDTQLQSVDCESFKEIFNPDSAKMTSKCFCSLLFYLLLRGKGSDGKDNDFNSGSGTDARASSDVPWHILA